MIQELIEELRAAGIPLEEAVARAKQELITRRTVQKANARAMARKHRPLRLRER